MVSFSWVRCVLMWEHHKFFSTDPPSMWQSDARVGPQPLGVAGTQSCPKVSAVDWQLHSWLALWHGQFTQLLFLRCFCIGNNTKDYLSSCTVNPEENYWHAVNIILFYKCPFANSHHSDMASCLVTFLGKVNNLYSSRQDTNTRPKKGLLGSSLGNP